MLLIDGVYDDDQIPHVFTGSHNYAMSALRNADESLVRVRSREIHEAYLRQNFLQGARYMLWQNAARVGGRIYASGACPS